MLSLMSEEERAKKSGVNQPLGKPRFWAEKNTSHYSFGIFQADDDEVFRMKEYLNQNGFALAIASVLEYDSGVMELVGWTVFA